MAKASFAGGYAGQTLYVDLTSGKSWTEPVSEASARRFLGGQGFAGELAYQNIPAHADPLGPENALIFSAGTLLGTLSLGAAKSTCMGKSPLTQTLIACNGGSRFPVMLKMAGYDSLVILGKAARPVTLQIDGDEVKLADARHLWGRDTWEATDALQAALPGASVACIGQAGENKTRFALILLDKIDTYGRGGPGAVMGSKNLKAIAVRGAKGIQVADRQGFQQLIERDTKKFMDDPLREDWRELGTMVAWNSYGDVGYSSTNNWGEAFPDEVKGLYGVENYRKVRQASLACPACPLGCKALLDTGVPGRGVTASCALGGGKWYGVIQRVGGWPEVVRCFELNNRYGIDHFSSITLLDFAIDLYQRGVITLAETGGWAPRRGLEAALEWTEMVARRIGFGDVMADGWLGAIERFGGAEYAVQIKGLDPPFDPRCVLGTETFGELTEPRGGHCTHSLSVTILAGRTLDQLRRYAVRVGAPASEVERIVYQAPLVANGTTHYFPSRLTKWVQDYNLLITSLGACNRPPIARLYDAEACAEHYRLATGIALSVPEMVQAAERTWNVERAFLAREGITRADDAYPPRLLRDKLKVGDQEVPPLDAAQINRFLDEYYDERGWDVARGWPTPAKLAELGLNDIGADLQQLK